VVERESLRGADLARPIFSGIAQAVGLIQVIVGLVTPAERRLDEGPRSRSGPDRSPRGYPSTDVARLAPVALATLLAACTASSECTTESCSSTLTIALSHTLDLSSGPHRLEVTTPSADLRCSVGPEPAGDATCFGFRFTDLRWDETTITLVLTEPFVDAPFEQIEVAVSRAGDEVWREIVDVDAGEAERPNGPDCPGACWRATAAATL